MKLLTFFLLILFSFSAYSKTILFLGDSLTEGYGVGVENSFPTVFTNLAKKAGFDDLKIVNGGVSGSTTASGLKRLKWFLRSKPDTLFLALGANDGLRGVDLKKSKQNLLEIIKTAKSKSIEVVLAGMQLPPNYGIKYTYQFKKMFVDIARDQKIKLYPFLLEGVAGKKNLNLPDGIHPNSQGHEVIGKKVFEFLKGNLK